MRFLPEESLIIGKLKSSHSHSEKWFRIWKQRKRRKYMWRVRGKSFNMALLPLKINFKRRNEDIAYKMSQTQAKVK